MTPHSSDPQIFEQRYYQRLHDIERTHWWAVGMRSAMRSLLGRTLNSRGLRVFDVGCGTGYLLQHFVGNDPGARCAGCDLSFDAVALAHALGARRTVVSSAESLPVRSKAFDLVTCVDVLQHLTDAQIAATLSESRRVLRSGGTLFVRSNSALLHAGAERSEWYRRFTVRELEDLIAGAGFHVVRASYLNALPSLWGWIGEIARAPGKAGAHDHHHHTHQPGLAIKPYPSHLRWLNALMRGVSNAEAAVVRKANLPFGHSTAVVAVRRD